MKRLLTLVLATLILASPAPSLAQPSAPPGDLAKFLEATSPLLLKPSDPPESMPILPAATPPPPPPVVYTVVEGDNLITIASSHNTDWQRIWAKNTQLSNPDVLTVGEQLTIPPADEQLARDVPSESNMPNAPPAASFGAYTASVGGLTGSLGYALPGGNCVNEPGVNNPHDGTNPISWAVLYGYAHIGSTALFPYNHVGVVSGIWSNGDLEIRHQNCPGCATRYAASFFRGFR